MSNISLSSRAGATLALMIALSVVVPASGAPIISEIMFHPAGVPENVGHEFIELHNPDGVAFDLTGCRFDRGVTFTFPAVSIPAGGYLAVAANLPAFQAKYPSVTVAVGGWTGSLSNTSEEVRLVDPFGVEIDSVDYGTEGDWGVRVRETQFNGWDWESLADGGGRSIELINPVLGNNNGQNWAPGSADDGTPGQMNSINAANTAPLIKDIQHRPVVPRSNEPIRVSCDIEDEVIGGDSATLFWRVSSTSPPPFSVAPMTDDGTGEFSAVLAPQPDTTVIEFHIQATDGVRARTWPAPTSEGQNANALFQVDDEVVPAGQAIVRLVLSVGENNAYNASGGGSNREYNVTVLGDVGSGESVHYLGGMRTRGASSRQHDPRPMRVSVPNDDKFEGVRVFNLNPRYSYLQVVGYKLFQAAGLRAPGAHPIQVRRNGVNNIRNDEFDYGRWSMVEHLDSDFIDEHWPLDSAGNLYKKVRPDNDWAYHEQAVTREEQAQAYFADGWSKETNTAADQWSDLHGLMRVMNGDPASPDYLADIQFFANVPQWMRWFAMETIIANGETNASNGADDDYSMYRGLVSPKFEFIPHDLDTILSYGDGSAITGPEHTLFDMSESNDVLEPLVPFFDRPSIRQAYFIALRDFASTIFDPAFFNPFIDNHLGGWVDPVRIQGMKDFIALRRTFVLDSTVPEVGPYTPVAPTTVGTLSSPRAAPVVINEVLARNVAAYPRDGLFPDMIELRNYSASAVDLSGRSLTDTPDIKDKFVFPPGTSLPAGAYLVLLADVAPAGGGTGTYLGFSISQEGDGVYFYSPLASGQTLIDSIVFGPQAPDFSIGRTGANGDIWRLGVPSPGGANGTQSTGNVAQIRLNEWLANPDFRIEDDFIEIYNPLTSSVALGGLVITDDAINYPTRHSLPALSFIGPQGFTVLSPKGDAASAGNPSELPFKISYLSGWAMIRGNNGAAIDVIDIDTQFKDVSRGRSPNGAATHADFTFPTPGLSNTPPPAAVQTLMDSLRITEINYDPQGGNAYEFIELQNIGAASINLAGVRFNNGIQFTFPSINLAPGAYTVLVRDFAAFQSRYGTGRPVAGVYSGALDNNGETIGLSLPNPWDVNILSFRYETDWHPAASGGGFTLEIFNASEVAPEDWDERESWLAGSVAHGTPGGASPPVVTSPLTANGTVGEAFSYTITGTNDPTSFSASGLPAGLAVIATTGAITGTPTVAGMFNVSIGAANSSGAGNVTLVLSVAQQPPPVITSPLSAGTFVNSLFSYQIAATNHPTSFTAAGRPAWLEFNPATGLLSGTPTAAGFVSVTISATNSAGTDTGTLVIQVVPDEISSAADAPNLAFNRAGNTLWFRQTGKTHDGIDAAQSGDIGDGQSTWIETTVNGPGRLSFWWAVSSEGGWDYLRFRIDNTAPVQITGEKDWEQKQFDLPAGAHTLRWTYEKDSIVSQGADAGWVDQIVITDPDVDLDGLSDIWENNYFGNLSRNGTGDFDRDGQSDFSEFIAGTVPTSPSSMLNIVSVESQGTDRVRISWNSVPGRVYQVEASADLASWFDVGPLVPAGGPTASTVVGPPEPIDSNPTLVPEVAPVRVLVPTSDVGTLWRGGDEAAFAASGGDAGWTAGTTGIGYEQQPGTPTSFVPYIGTAVPEGVNTSALCRIRFNLDSPEAVTSLVLSMRYDDGFAAWINGQRVAGHRDPATLTWDSASTGNEPDENQAISLRPFNVAPPFTFLRTGENILAVQALNGDVGSSDFLAQPSLTAQLSFAFPPGRVFWRVIVVTP